MINRYLASQIKLNFPFTPTSEQEIAIDRLSEFLLSDDDRKVFLLCGYAGTGKTSLISALVRTMEQLERKTTLLAPTGRAAKVFSSYSGKSARTIHKCIYRQKSIMDSATFTLTANRAQNTLFIVDEASMISNNGNAMTGSCGLLDDLIEFVYSGHGCSLLLLGDTAQLPPIGEVQSPALTESYLRSMFLNVTSVELKQVMRQLNDSGILFNATMLRQRIEEEETYELPQITLKGFADICNVQGEELIEAIESSYNKAGIDETIILCRSNKRANVYNEGIRRRILYREEELSRGDMLMIVKNNYHYAEHDKESPMTFVANGDVVRLKRIRRFEEFYGFRFIDATLQFPDYDDYLMDAKVMLDTLSSESPSLTREQSKELFLEVEKDYLDIKAKNKRYREIRENPYFNAMQVKFAYAVTCHKAQGGQWSVVFIDRCLFGDEPISKDMLRWLYTAITRATEKVYLVNFDERFFDAE